MAKKFHITGMGMALPKRIVDNHELAKTLDTTDEWIVSHTGIRSRHICGSDETTGTLAAQAAGLLGRDSAACPVFWRQLWRLEAWGRLVFRRR